MRHRKSGRKYSRTKEHRLAMFRNLLMNLIRHSRIQTTDAKAKGLKRIADKVISLARTNNLTNIRKVSYFVRDKELLKKLFTEIGPKFTNRFGGYTRIYKVGIRRGDGAPMSIIEFAFEEEKKGQKKQVKKMAGKEKKGSKKSEKLTTGEKKKDIGDKKVENV
ncbi:MAG: 50S ribosomal protein L17 [Deltaproteobacteria bacterium]|nr:50S ribosomal protein L17 [Deltaproteobacteria bacterium]